MSINEPASPDNPLIETYAHTLDQQPSQPTPAGIDPDNPPWGLGKAVLVWFISLVLLILLQIAVGVPYVFFKKMTL